MLFIALNRLITKKPHTPKVFGLLPSGSSTERPGYLRLRLCKDSIEKDYISFAQNVDASLLSTNVAGGFVGAYLGMYAASNNTDTQNYADFDWFEYFPCDF